MARKTGKKIIRRRPRNTRRRVKLSKKPRRFRQYKKRHTRRRLQKGGSAELVGNVHFDKIGSLLDVPTSLITLSNEDVRHFKEKMSLNNLPLEPVQRIRRSYRLPNKQQCM